MIMAIPFRAFDVNLMSCAYVDGLPSMAGINGLVYALTLKLNARYPDTDIPNWMISYCDVTPDEGKKRLAVCTTAQGHKSVNASDQVSSRGRVTGTLYLDVECVETSDGHAMEAIMAALPRMRFCGGQFETLGEAISCETVLGLPDMIVKASQGKVHFFVENKTDQLNPRDRLGSLIKLIQRPRRGWYDRDGLDDILANIRSIIQDDCRCTDEVMALLTWAAEHEEEIKARWDIGLMSEMPDIEHSLLKEIVPEGDKNQTIFENIIKSSKSSGNKIYLEYINSELRYALELYDNDLKDVEYPGYLVPIHIGYSALEPMQEKPGTRLVNNAPAEHAMAEPIVGMARLRTHYSLISALRCHEQPQVWWYADNGLREHFEFYLTT